MSTNRAQLLQDALALPPQERAQLVDEILASFVAQPDQTTLEKWGEEAESRLDAIERGELATIPADEVFENLKRRRTQ